MFVENLGPLSEIDIVPYLINQPQFVFNPNANGRAYTIQIWMLYHASCKPFIVLFMFQNIFIPCVLLINLFKQINSLFFVFVCLYWLILKTMVYIIHVHR